MSRRALEVADIFRDYGAGWRQANRGHVSLDQMKVMSAIERCRTVALGGHVAQCEHAECGHTHIAYNSCRNRHCPKCQGAAARDWLADREAELLPVGYFHVVFTLPAPIADIAYQNKRVVYDLLMKVSAETMIKIASDPKHLGAKIGITSVLHTWGSAMTHHPHVHMIVPGGGISLARGEEGDSSTGNKESQKWIACRRNFFLPVRVLSRLFRRLFLEKLVKAHDEGHLNFFGRHANLSDRASFDAVLAYLSRYTHRVAISNRRLLKSDANGITFRVKNYRANGPDRYTTMTLSPYEFIRRFMIHVLPKGLHRIRHYGLFANGNRAANIARARELLGVAAADPLGDEEPVDVDEPRVLAHPCPSCGGRMIIVEAFAAGQPPRHRATPEGIDSS